MKQIRLTLSRFAGVLFCAIVAAALSGGFALSASAAETGMTKVRMETSAGVIVLAIDESNAPTTAGNFLQYVNDGFFDGVIFHRIIPGFVIQGGGFLPDMTMRQTRAPIKYERSALLNKKYSISMARTSDPNSATSQFFINLNDNVQLDGSGGAPGYAVFGRVVEGTEVVDTIAAARTGIIKLSDTEVHSDFPVADIVIIKAQVQQAQKAEDKTEDKTE